LAYRRYTHQLKKFEILYEHFGRDLRRFIEFLKDLRTSGEEPSYFLEKKLSEFSSIQ